MKACLNLLFFDLLLLSVHSALDKVISFFLVSDFTSVLEVLLHEVGSSAMSGVKLEFVAACAALSHKLLLSD